MTLIGGLLLLKLGRSQRSHRQRVNLLSHAVAERAIDVLVTGDTRLTFERRAYDQRLKVPAIAGYFDHFAFEAIRYVALDVAGGWVH